MTRSSDLHGAYHKSAVKAESGRLKAQLIVWLIYGEQ